MTHRQLQYGENNPHLRTPAQEIMTIDQNILDLAQDMNDLMIQHDGVGIAGPQVGSNKRIIIVTQWKQKKGKVRYKGEICMINPIILSYSPSLYDSQEGCLSLPGKEALVQRHESITVQYTGLDKKTYTRDFSNFDAAIVQHEIDHLDGILFIDKYVPGTLQQ